MIEARSRRRFALVAWAITIAGLLLHARLGFVSFPFDQRHDEPVLVNGALKVARTLDLHPPEPGWGTVPFYVLAACYRAGHSVADLSLVEAGDAHFAIARWAALVCTALALLGTAYAGRIAFGEHCGWIAAGALAIAPLTVEYAAQAVVDAWVLGATALSLVAAARIAAGSAPTSTYVLGGAAAGIAAACRITGGSAIVSLLVAWFVARPRPSWNRLAWCIGGAATAFALANPYALINLPRFLGGLSSMSDRYSTAYIDAPTGSTRSWHSYGFVLDQNLGIVGTGALLFLIGLVVALRRDLRKTVALLSSSVLLYAVVGSFLLCIPRQILPILPAACILCALPGAIALDKVLAGRRSALTPSSNWPGMPLAWFGLAALGPIVLLFAQRMQDLATTRLPDTRLQLLAWLDANVPDGSNVVREADTPRMDELARRSQIHWVSSVVFGGGRARAASADFVVVNDDIRRKVDSLAAHLAREQGLYRELFEGAQPLATFSAEGGDARGPTFYVFGALSPELRARFGAP